MDLIVTFVEVEVQDSYEYGIIQPNVDYNVHFEEPKGSGNASTTFADGHYVSKINVPKGINSKKEYKSQIFQLYP